MSPDNNLMLLLKIRKTKLGKKKVIFNKILAQILDYKYISTYYMMRLFITLQLRKVFNFLTFKYEHFRNEIGCGLYFWHNEIYIKITLHKRRVVVIY